MKSAFTKSFKICLHLYQTHDNALIIRLCLRTIAGKYTCGGSVASPGTPNRRAVTTMGSNDMVVGEVHMLGPSCQRYNWQTGRCGSIALDSSSRRGKTIISNPAVLRKYPHRRVPTNWVSGRTLQPSIETTVANSFVPSDFLVDGQVNGLENVQPLLTINFFSTWILLLLLKTNMLYMVI